MQGPTVRRVSLLLLVSAATLLGLIGSRQMAGIGVPDGVLPESLPLWVSALLSGFALAASGFAFIGWRRLILARRRLDSLGADATRIMLGEYGHQAGDHDKSALEPIANAVNRLGEMVAAAESIIADRDRQLETLRGLCNAAYWETDERGRFIRVELEPSWPRGSRLAMLGSLVFEGAEPLDATRWQSARDAIASRKPFQDLPLTRLAASARPIRVIESGRPRFGSDGRFLGYVGITRLIESANPFGDDAAIRTVALASTEPALILSLDRETPVVRWMNPAASRFFERASQGAAAVGLDDLLEPAQDAVRDALHSALAERRPLRTHAWFRNRFGERIQACARLEPVPAAPSRAVLSIDPRESELNALRMLSGEQQSLRRELERQSEQLEQRTRDQEAFLYGVSHDLRAPLRMIEGFARLLREDHQAQLDPIGRAHLEKVLTGCARMQQMIETVLSLARTSTQPLMRRPVDLSRIAREVIDALRHQQPDRQTEVRIADSMSARGDPTLLRRLLENLIGNAWKYTGKRPVGRISLDCVTDEDGRQVFSVSDNGAGFDMQHADRLFSLFQRLHSESEFPGTGVGLATAQRIVQRHGGEIWAESAPGRGSRFSFTLGHRPMEPISGGANRPAAADSGQVGLESLSP